MEAEQPSDLAVEVDFASLDAGPKERTLAHFEDFSGQAEAIGLDKPPNTDTVSDFNLCHCPTLSKNLCGVINNYLPRN
jgi:hypothetical protein